MEPLDSDFNLSEHGLFRTFQRRVDRLATVNLDVRFPLPGLNFIELGPVPLPLSLGVIAFSDGALLSTDRLEVRAEAGVGLTLRPYGQPRNLVRVEFPLWLNMEEDGGKREVRFRFNVRF